VIHYDRPHATGVEGYPDLVVHGPLLAPGVVRSVTYRLVRPAFGPAVVVGAGSGDDVTVAVAAQGARPSLTASIRLD
jgi:3-methylfumaryl-CoA hydratase